MTGSCCAAAKRKRSPVPSPAQSRVRWNRRPKRFASFLLPTRRPSERLRAKIEIHEPPAATGIQTWPPPLEVGPSEWRCEWTRRRLANRPAASDIQVHDFQRVVFNKLAACFHVFTHQRRKNVFRRNSVFELYLKQRARVRIHGRVP